MAVDAGAGRRRRRRPPPRGPRPAAALGRPLLGARRPAPARRAHRGRGHRRQRGDYCAAGRQGGRGGGVLPLAAAAHAVRRGGRALLDGAGGATRFPVGRVRHRVPGRGGVAGARGGGGGGEGRARPPPPHPCRPHRLHPPRRLVAMRRPAGVRVRRSQRARVAGRWGGGGRRRRPAPPTRRGLCRPRRPPVGRRLSGRRPGARVPHLPARPHPVGVRGRRGARVAAAARRAGARGAGRHPARPHRARRVAVRGGPWWAGRHGGIRPRGVLAGV